MSSVDNSRFQSGAEHAPTLETKRKSRILLLVTALLIVLNFSFAIVIRHVLHSPIYKSTGHLRELLPWALAINICFGTIILCFARAMHWRSQLQRVLASTVLVSAVPLLLPLLLRIIKAQPRVHAIGLAYAIFLALVALVAAYYAISNSSQASRRSLQLWILAVSTLIYVGTSGWMRITTRVTGDEPHYLLLTHSLVHDHDFDLANNYVHKDYWSFYPAVIDPHTVPGRNGTAMLWHDIGLPILMIPGYVLGGRLGAMLQLNLIAALLALSVYEAALELGAAPAGAIVAWALSAFSAPLIIFASQLFPETVGAACALWATVLFSRFMRLHKRPLLWWTGVLLAVLPWLSIRYWVVLAPIESIIGLFLIVRPVEWKQRLKELLALTVPLGCTVALFAWFDWVHFGTVLPNAGYLRVVTTMYPQYTHSRPIVGLLGLLFDRTRGLIPVAPVYLIALAGLILAAGTRKWQVACLAGASMSYLTFMGFSEYWMGGWGAPARYALMAALLWAPATALAVRTRSQRQLLVVLASWAAFIAIAYTAFPLTRYPYLLDPATSNLDVLVRSYIGIRVDRIFPSLIRGARTDYELTAAWLSLSILCVSLLAYSEIRRSFTRLRNRQAKISIQDQSA